MEAGHISPLYPRIAIYSTQTCAFCKDARNYFDHLGLPYEEVDLSHAPAEASPAIEIAGQRVLGFNRQVIDRMLDLAFDQMACVVDT
jgi:arsenate reductase-like glutaredoxin family protein